MSIRQNIIRLRQQHNITQKELAKIAGVSRGAVSQWEGGFSEPRMGAIQKIADYFNILKSNLIEDNGMNFSRTALVKLPVRGSTATLPLRTLGKACADVMDNDGRCDNKEIQVPEAVVQMHPGAFVLRVEGDCMNKIIPEGCHVAVDASATPQDGSIVVVENEQYKHIMRKYYRGSSVVVLSPVSFNEAYEDTVISGDETLNLVGVVVWWQSSDMME